MNILQNKRRKNIMNLKLEEARRTHEKPMESIESFHYLS
jgi:hypothetical protein